MAEIEAALTAKLLVTTSRLDQYWWYTTSDQFSLASALPSCCSEDPLDISIIEKISPLQLEILVLEIQMISQPPSVYKPKDPSSAIELVHYIALPKCAYCSSDIVLMASRNRPFQPNLNRVRSLRLFLTLDSSSTNLIRDIKAPYDTWKPFRGIPLVYYLAINDYYLYQKNLRELASIQSPFEIDLNYPFIIRTLPQRVSVDLSSPVLMSLRSRFIEGVKNTPASFPMNSSAPNYKGKTPRNSDFNYRPRLRIQSGLSEDQAE